MSGNGNRGRRILLALLPAWALLAGFLASNGQRAGVTVVAGFVLLDLAALVLLGRPAGDERGSG